MRLGLVLGLGSSVLIDTPIQYPNYYMKPKKLSVIQDPGHRLCLLCLSMSVPVVDLYQHDSDTVSSLRRLDPFMQCGHST